jgi:hypothetical protein
MKNKKLKPLSDPKSPPAVVKPAQKKLGDDGGSGNMGTQFGPIPANPQTKKMSKMPPFPTWGAPTKGQRVRKLPSLSDPKS